MGCAGFSRKGKKVWVVSLQQNMGGRLWEGEFLAA